MKSQESQAELPSVDAGQQSYDDERQNYGNVKQSKIDMNNGKASIGIDGGHNTPDPDQSPLLQDNESDSACAQRPNLNTSTARQSPVYDAYSNPLGAVKFRGSRKSIETLPISTERIAGQQEASVNAYDSPSKKGDKITVTQFQNQNEQVVPIEYSRQMNEIMEDEVKDQMLSSMELARFKNRNNTKRKKLVAQSPYNQLYATLTKHKENSSQSNRQKNLNQYDMSIGITAKNLNEIRQDSTENRSMRKTVTIDFMQSQEEQFTNTEISVEDQNDSHKHNEEVQTIDDLEEDEKIVLQDQRANNSKLSPTVISLTNLPISIETDSIGQSTIDNMYLGTPTTRERPKYTGRLASVNDNPAVAVLDQLANIGSDDEKEEDENPHLNKLRNLLLIAMRMSKTSSDKTWNQMTPFERAKIKQIFQELLRDMSKTERRPGMQPGIGMSAAISKHLPNADLIQELNNCLVSQPIQQAQRPQQNSPLVSINTRVQNARLNSDLLLSPALATYGMKNSTRFEHFVFIDDNLKVPTPRRICVAKDSQRHTKKSSLKGWDPARSGSFTPKFSRKQMQAMKVNTKLKKQNSPVRKTSYQPSNTRKIITKSQATDTEVDDTNGYKPSSAAEKTNSEFIDDTDDQNRTNEHVYKEATISQYQEEFINLNRHENSPTMMRKTPNSRQPLDALGVNFTSEDQKEIFGLFETNIGHMYNTGGPGMFTADGLGGLSPSQLDNVDPAVFETDLRFESKLLVADHCLNSTKKSHTPEQHLITNAESQMKSITENSIMTPLGHILSNAQGQQELNEGDQHEYNTISEAEARKIIRKIVPPMDLPKIVKYIKSTMPFRLKIAPPPEEPNFIVESTLQAISLTKQHEKALNKQIQEQKQIYRQGVQKKTSRHLVVNSDISSIKISDNDNANFTLQQKNFLSRKAYLDAIMLEHTTSAVITEEQAIEEKTSENLTSVMKVRNSNSMITETKLSGAIADLNEQLAENLNHAGESRDKSSQMMLETIRLNMQNSSDLDTKHNLELHTRHVTKSPTHKELGQNDREQAQKVFPKKAALSKYASPSAQDTNYLRQIESATEKSSVYQTFMISKLASGSGSSDPSIQKKNRQGSKYQRKAAVSRIQEHQEEDSPRLKNHIKQQKVNRLSPVTLRGQTQIKKQPQIHEKSKMQQHREANNLTGWEQTNNSSSIDMLVTNQKQVNPNQQTGIILAHNSSVDAKLILLENRMAEHNIESLVLQGNNKVRVTNNTSIVANPKLQFSQLMTHAALRRSDIKSRANNNNDINQSLTPVISNHVTVISHKRQQQMQQAVIGEPPSDNGTVRLGHIQGTKKDLTNFSNKKQNFTHETASKMTAKLDYTEISERSVIGVIGAIEQNNGNFIIPAGNINQTFMNNNNNNKSGGGQLDTENSSENLFPTQQMVEIKAKLMVAEDMIGDDLTPKSPIKSKQHGSSVSKLIPSSPSKQMSKVKLESSTSNPSMHVIQVRQAADKLHQIAALSQGGYSLYKVTMLAESHHSSSPAPYKMQGTQAFARTPSKVSESDQCGQSLKQGYSALPQKRKPIQNVINVQKLNQTQTQGFVNKNQTDLMNMINLQNASEEQTETNYDPMPMRATLDGKAEIPRKSIMRQLVDGDTSEGDSPCRDNSQMRNQVKMSNMTLPKTIGKDSSTQVNKKSTFGVRSQSLAPPVMSQRAIIGGYVIEDEEDIIQKKRNTTTVSPSRVGHKLKSKKKKQIKTEAVFPSSQKPHQELPKMQNLNLIQGGEQPLFGKKQDLRTPLDKLLTSAQMEEFQSLIGSKTYHRKLARLKGHLRTSSEQQSQETMTVKTQNFAMLNTLNTTFMPGLQTTKGNKGQLWSPRDVSQLTQLKFPPFNQTFVADYLDESISKKNTVEHVKRVKNLSLQASKDNQVIFIDPIAGTAQLNQAGMNTTQAPKPSPKHYINEKKNMLATNLVHSRKSRASPFQATGPFSFTNNPKSTATTQQQHALLPPQTTGYDMSPRGSSHLLNLQKMPPVSQRYRSSKQRNSSDTQTNTFIFNDVNKLASDLRKNSALVKPIFQSLS